MIETLKIVDVDPLEADELKQVVAEAREEGAYLHVEVRREVSDASPDRDDVMVFSHPVRPVDIETKPEVWYYVETSWRPRGATEPLATQFMAHLVKASKPKDAEKVAVGQVFHRHGGGIEAEVFMSRRLTDEKAVKLAEQFDSGSWEGWRF